MTRLKLEIGRYHNVVFGRVVEQADELRGAKLPQPLRSINLPALSVDGDLFVNGARRNRDGLAFSCVYATPERAIEVIAAIKAAVAKVNAGPEPEQSDALCVKLEIVE